MNASWAAIPELRDSQVQWLAALSAASGLEFVLDTELSSEQETLEALGSGRVQMADLSALGVNLARQQEWAWPAAMVIDATPSAGAIMFIARTDSGLTPGPPPDVFRQLEGRRPCWPEQRADQPTALQPLAEYLLPTGLLAQHGVTTATPVLVQRTPNGNGLEAAVFRGQCDFAVVEAVPPPDYTGQLPTDLRSVGFERWATEMQILYTTPPLLPGSMVALTPELPPEVRERIQQAIFATPRVLGIAIRYGAVDDARLSHFGEIVASSGVDVAPYLWRTPRTVAERSAAPQSPATPTTADPDTLVVDINPQNGAPFVPGGATGALHGAVMAAISAGLTRLDATGRHVPILVEQVPSHENNLARIVGSGEDAYLEVTFPLRSPVSWHDGHPLTAADVVFSWNYVMSPGWPGSRYGVAGYAAELFVTAVEAPSLENVVYRFMSQREARAAAVSGGRIGDPSVYAGLAQQRGPVVPLDYLEVGRWILPQHLLAATPADQLASSRFAQKPVYAGAYRLAGIPQPEQPVVLEAFDGFAVGKPTIPRIVLGAEYRFPEADPYWQPPALLEQALRADAVQAQLGLPFVLSREGADPRAFDRLATSDDVAVDWVARDAWETLDFNLDNPHLADPLVRQAIAHAIDRQAIVEQTLAGHGQLMRSYLPSWHPLYAGDNALPDYGYDPVRARTLLIEAGYDLSITPAQHPERGPLALRLDSMDVAPWPRQPTASLIKQQLGEIGVTLEVTFHTWEKFEGQDCSAIRNGRRFDLGLAGWAGAPNRYPVGWVNQALASASIPSAENGCPYEKSNWSGWRNSQADALLPQLTDGRLALEQPDAYGRAWAGHQQLWATDLPSLALFNVLRPVTTSRALHGVEASPFAFSSGVEDTWNIHTWTYTR